MANRIQGMCAVFLVALLAGATAVTFAQGSGARVDIGFSFHAAGRVLPAGSYRIAPGAADSIIVESEKVAADRVILPIITLLGRHDLDREPELIFDKLNGQLHLSEVWLPGRDGYCLLTTKGPHEHHVVGGPLGKK